MVVIILLVLLIIAVILYLKAKIGTLVMMSCFFNATGREPTNAEIKESSEFVAKNIINDIKSWFGNKN